MARLRQKSATRVDSSDDWDFFSRTSTDDQQTTSRSSRRPPRKKEMSTLVSQTKTCTLDGSHNVTLVPKLTPRRAQFGRQLPLRPILNDSLLRKPLPDFSLDEPLRRSRKKASKPMLDELSSKASARERVLPGTAQPIAAKDEEDGEFEVEESIWCGSDADSDESEDELPSPRKLFQPRSTAVPRPPAASNQILRSPAKKTLSLFSSTEDLPRIQNSQWKSSEASRPTSSSDKETTGAIIRFSPPRLRTIPDSNTSGRPVTPPQSPSKSRLQSPSKTRTYIPTPPLRQSLDAFWNADTVNDWNEQYSPKKMIKSPRRLKFLQDDQSQSPSSSPRKALPSPSKRSKAEIEIKKHFTARKHRLAEDFLSELDQVVTSGQISSLSAPTGGVKIIWSKTLNTTAGRANWRKETTKTKTADGTTSVTYKHHASIELAEKVIDDENRLLNVIAHEFCHLANFMISGIKDQPHGQQFKVWGRKTTAAFRDRGIEVTTKHSYQIEYKFIWQCSNEDCGAEFGRHSKSIDPKRKVCGKCKGRLVQIKPVPRKEKEGGSGGYAGFVKENFAELKRSLPGSSQKEVMEAVARKYRAEKEAKEKTVGESGAAKKPEDELKGLARALEVITIDDD